MSHLGHSEIELFGARPLLLHNGLPCSSLLNVALRSSRWSKLQGMQGGGKPGHSLWWRNRIWITNSQPLCMRFWAINPGYFKLRVYICSQNINFHKWPMFRFLLRPANRISVMDIASIFGGHWLPPTSHQLNHISRLIESLVRKVNLSTLDQTC